MKSTRINRHFTQNESGRATLPRMAIYAICLLLALPFWLYRFGSQRTEMGLITPQQLPITHTIACKGPTEFAVISLNQQGQFAFSVLGVSPQVQAAAVQQVANQRNVYLNENQFFQLQSLLFLTVATEELPRLLSLPYHRRGQLVALAEFKPINEEQIIACAVAARHFNKTLFHRPITISLRVDAEASSVKVMRLIEQLQAWGFNSIEYQNQFVD